MNTDKKLDYLIERVETLEKLMLAMLPAGRKPAARVVGAVYRPHEVLARRKTELLRLFEACWKQGHAKKLKQGFNSAILRPVDGTGPVREIVPVSILLNRCSLRKAFSPIFELDEKSSMENARLALEACVTTGHVGLSPIADVANTGTNKSKPVTSQTSVAVSRAELVRLGIHTPVAPVAKPTLVWSNTETDNDELIDSEEFEEE